MPNSTQNMSLASSGATTNSGAPSASPTLKAPIEQNASYPMSVEPKKKAPLQNASYPMSVEPKTDVTPAPAPVPTPAPVPAVITAKPAVDRARSQIADVNQMSADVEAKQVKEAEAPAFTGKDFESSDPAVQARIKEMQMKAETSSKTVPPPAAIKAKDETVAVPTVDTVNGEKMLSNSYVDQLNAQDAKSQGYLEDYIEKSSQIMNGSFPLSPDQQAEVNSITQQYQNMISEQRSVNQSYQNGLTMAGVSSGRSMYAPEIELGNINAAISAGVAKISALNADMLSSIAEAKSAIKSDNMDLLNSTYEHISDVMAQRRDTLKETHKATQEAITAAKEDYSTMREEILSMASVGKDPSEFSEGFFDKLDTQREKLGLPSYGGYTKDLYNLQYETSQDTRESEAESAALDRAEKINNILDGIPVGTSIEIGGYQYEGRDRGEIKTGTETDSNGNVNFWSYDSISGEVTTTNLGAIGKAEDGWETKFDDNGEPWRINSKTGAMQPFFPSNEQTNIQQTWPDGSTSPFLDGNGNPRTECGMLTNDLLGMGVGNEVETKLNKCDPSIKPGSDNPPRVGDMFVQAAGFGWTGHVGIVCGVETTPDGKTQIRCLESNYPQADKITSTRVVDASKIAGFGRQSQDNWSPVLKQLLGGTDTPSNRPTFGSKNKASEAKQLSPSEIKAYRDLGYDVNPGMTAGDVIGMPKMEGKESFKVPTKDEFTNDLIDKLPMDVAAKMNFSEIDQMYEQTIGKMQPIVDATEIITAMDKMTAKQSASIMSTVNKALERGDIEGARQQVQAAAIASLPTPEATLVRGRTIAISQLQKIQGQLEDYKNAGYSTDVISGTEAEMLAKIGKLSKGDSEKRKLATAIRTSLIDYRKSMSGAAFTESEMIEYKSLFPGIDSEYDLNMAKIGGLLDTWQSSNDATFRTIMTPSLYDQIWE